MGAKKFVLLDTLTFIKSEISCTGCVEPFVQNPLKNGLKLVHGQVTIIFVVSVCLSVCLCSVFLSRL